ncbi:hypothetical protein G4F03_001536 [Salmonella enterica]|nr:hypothetical protein [Salmonella enterica]EIC9366079.1 YadA-like family protein [Salmonella enterica]ELD2658730.1 YadA-like family protein [Salmonella enterica]
MENSDNIGSDTLQGCKAARLQGCKAARLQGCKAARLQGCKAARLQGCKAARPNNFSKSIKSILFPAFLSLLLSSNSVYAANTVYGDGAKANGEDSTAIGEGAIATGNSSIAIGVATDAEGDSSTAIGEGADTLGDNGVAIGAGADASGVNSVALGANSVTSRDNNVSIGGNDPDSGKSFTRTLSGLSSGTDVHDAINKGQLDSAKAAAIAKAKEYTDNAALEANDNVLKKANSYTDDKAGQTLKSANNYTNYRAAQAENNAVARSNAYTDNRFGELRKNLEHTEKRLNAGIAGVTALASIPYVEGNKFSYGVGAGTYQNGNAVAAGVQFRVSPSTNVRLNISWDSAGNNATGVGIAGGW